MKSFPVLRSLASLIATVILSLASLLMFYPSILGVDRAPVHGTLMSTF